MSLPQICPASIEATLFAFIMSMNNLGDTYGVYFGSWLQNNSLYGRLVSSSDFMGLGAAQAMRVLFKLTPVCHKTPH